MKHYQTLDDVHLVGVWLTIGSFDGVHLGHQAILKGLTAGAHAVGAPAVVLTFHPHPAVVLGKRADFPYLTSPAERAALMAEMGVDVVITQPFDRQLANLTALEFMTRLHQQLGLRHLCVGHDFALGRGRQGDLPTLEHLGQDLGYTLSVTEPVDLDGERISSSRVRAALAQGDVELASRLLGRPYQLSGAVVHGDGRGRTLGIPTANLEMWAGKTLPTPGVYACLAQVDGSTYQAVTNVGYRPTFPGSPEAPLVETHLLEFNRDLYQQQMELAFIARLRDEQRFPNIQALVAQIGADITQARHILAGTGPGK
ncbi:MAG: bifunctional riboflavin kinase/FAD synthetase [Chloroflexota bacterium]